MCNILHYVILMCISFFCLSMSKMIAIPKYIFIAKQGNLQLQFSYSVLFAFRGITRFLLYVLIFQHTDVMN